MATARERVEYRQLVFPGRAITDQELDRHIKREHTTKFVVSAAAVMLLAVAVYLFLR